MANIIDLSYFQQADDLNIPLSQNVPVANPSIATPNSTAFLTNLITEVERSVLLNALGLAKYEELQIALENPPLTGDLNNLVNGDVIDNRKWDGLKKLLAYAVYQAYMSPENQSFLTGLGSVQTNPENANLVTGSFKIAHASNQFIKRYQKGYCMYPHVYGNVVDWIGGANRVDPEMSLYEYMVLKNYDLKWFKAYEQINSFGL